jgi:glutathione S-transferase
MKLYDGGQEPEPRRVRIFLAEKGVSVPAERVEPDAPEHGSPHDGTHDPLEHAPGLELDDGTVITESMAICRYFEGIRPEPPLFGRGGREGALVEMWNRRVEHNLYEPVSAVFRHLDPAMSDHADQVPEWGEANKPIVLNFLRRLDRELRERLFIVGDHYTVADITALVAIDFMEQARLVVPDDLVHVQRWYAQVSARPSASA